MLLPIPFVLYLLLEGLLTRRWRWLHIMVIATVPALVIGGHYFLNRDVPPTPGAIGAGGRRDQFFLKEPWLRVMALRSLILLPMTALSAWAAIKLRPSRLPLIVPWALLVGVLAYNVDLPNELWAQMYEPPFTARFGPVSVDFPQEIFTFGGIGNIVRITGIDFFEYEQERVLPSEFWRGLWALGMALGVVLLAKMTDGFIDWLAERRRGVVLSPRVAFYGLGGIIFLVSIGLLGDIFDRYMFGFLPFVILFVVRGSHTWGRAAWTYSLVTLALIASFTLLAKADQVDHNNARWQAAEWLNARSGALHGGFDWDNWGGHVRNDDYQIADIRLGGYRVEREFPYFSRLGGFANRTLYAQSREGTPPLPVSP